MAAREQESITALERISDNVASAVRTADAAGSRRRYRIEVLADAAALARLKPEWDALLTQSGVDHPFLGHEWITSWWECFGAGRQLHILLARDGARLAGIAPLLRCDRKMYGLRVSCLAALYNPHTPRFDFIIAPHETADVCHGIWQYLRARTDWDLVELAQMPADSRALAELSRLARDDGRAVGLWHGEKSPYIPLAGTFDSYFGGLSYSHRSNLRRKLNRLREQGVLRLEEITGFEGVDDALNDGFRIEAAGWKAQTGTSIRSAPEVEAFYRLYARRAADAGRLRLLFLTLNGARIAFGYGLSHRNRTYVMKTGYDPEYSFYSPYNLLCYLVFQDGFARDLEEYEFLGNDDAWKLAWTRLAKRHDWLYIFAPGARARLLHRIKFRWIPRLRRVRGLRKLLPGRRGTCRLATRDGERLSSGHE